MNRKVVIAVLAVVALPLACDSAEPEYLPDLTGRYVLVSHTAKSVTSTPPRVSAALVLTRQIAEGGRASGALSFQMRRQADNGASSVGGGWGKYAHYANGTMAVSLGGVPFEGEYVLSGDTLITTLFSVVPLGEQALFHTPAGKLVWVLDGMR